MNRGIPGATDVKSVSHQVTPADRGRSESGSVELRKLSSRLCCEETDQKWREQNQQLRTGLTTMLHDFNQTGQSGPRRVLQAELLENNEIFRLAFLTGTHVNS